MNKTKLFLYIISLLGMLLLLYNLFILISYIPNGYHIDIIKQLPLQSWLCFIMVYFLGTFLVINANDHRFKIIGIIIIVLNYIVVFLIFNQLGYYADDKMDDLTYLAEIKSILWSGHINNSDIYPAALMLYAQISAITGIVAQTLSTLLPCLFSLIFVIGIFIISKLIIKIQEILYILLPTACIFYLHNYHFSTAPHFCYFTCTPIIMYLLFQYSFEKENRFSWLLIILPVIWLMPTMHPFIILVVLYSFIILLIVKMFFLKKTMYPLYGLIIMFILGYFGWAIANYGLHSFIRGTYITFINGLTENTLSMGLKYMSKASNWTTPFEFMRAYFLIYGRYFIPFVVILVALCFIIFNKKLQNTIKRTYYLFGSLIIIYGFLDIFLLVNPIYAHTVQRLTALNFFVYFLIPLFAISLYIIFLQNHFVILHIMAALILTLVMGVSLFGAFPSSWSYTANSGIVVNQVNGMRWLFEHKNAEPGAAVGEEQMMSRYYDLFYGWPENMMYRKDVQDFIMPDHFGYNDNTSNTYDNYYIIITTYAEYLYTDIWKYKDKQFDRFLPDDFNRFQNAPDYNHIYSSLNMDIYKQ